MEKNAKYTFETAQNWAVGQVISCFGQPMAIAAIGKKEFFREGLSMGKRIDSGWTEAYTCRPMTEAEQTEWTAMQNKEAARKKESLSAGLSA